MSDIPLIRCRGKCKSEKQPFLFAPADVRSNHPICRECRRVRRNAKFTPRGMAWRTTAKLSRLRLYLDEQGRYIA